MTAVLTGLRINEISLVPAGANQHAKVLLAKRAKSAEIAKVGPDSSLESKRDAIYSALTEALGYAYAAGGSGWYVEATYADRAIVCMAGKKWAYPVSFDTSGRVVLGIRAEVEIDYKPVNSQEEQMDLSKLSPEVRAHVEKQTAEIEKLKSDLETAKKAPEPAKAPEDVLKGLDGPAREIVEKAQRDAAEATKKAEESASEIRKIRDEQARATYIAKARELPHVGAKPEEFGPVLKEIAEKAPDSYKVLEPMLKALNEQIEKGTLFSERGTGGGSTSTDTAMAAARAKAQEMVSKGEAKTVEQGIVKVFKADPALYARHQAEQKGAN